MKLRTEFRLHSVAARCAIAVVAVFALLGGCGGGDDEGGGPTSSVQSTTTAATTTTVALEDDLRLNQIQVIGTHNSFHIAADPAERALVAAMNPEGAVERDYTHLPLTDQLVEQKVRAFELDVYVDTRGGRFADPAFRRQAELGPYDEPDMAEPGIKVFHEQDVDYHSRCVTFERCLTEIKAWSDANPFHVPVAINVQLRDGLVLFNVPGQAIPEKWDRVQMDALDEEITDVFPRERIITPDDVRGDRATLAEAIEADGWPTLGASRGKVFFLMINAEPYRTIYLQGHDSLRDRVVFTNSAPGQPDSAYVGIDDPIALGDEIRSYVEKGYLVRTRADEPGVEAKAGDKGRLQAALDSGAQVISTDYPGPDGARSQFGTDYTAQLPGFLAARCNPATAPAVCVDAAVEP